MSSHTQGPWEVMAHENGVFTVFEGGHAKNWADWSIAALNFTVQDAANARLIASAPDLLYQLQSVLDRLEATIERLPDTQENAQWEHETVEIFTEARAVMAKAKGK